MEKGPARPTWNVLMPMPSPHVSPDGRWIVMLSFGPDVAAEDHPFYRQVYLRLLPAAGGPAQVIGYLYGGQGTINVPSWSPDSRHLALVSNTGLRHGL